MKFRYRSVYKKPTHTDRYLNFTSNHHPRIKSGIVKCLTHRARKVCDKDSIDNEMTHLQHVFTTNNYPATVVTKCLNKIPKPRDANNTESSKQPAMLITPYIRGLSERLERKCRNLDIKLVFRSGNTLRSQLTHVKNRIDEEQVKGVVY